MQASAESGGTDNTLTGAVPATAQKGKLPIPRLVTPSPKANQQRTARACVACRARKTKCDGRKPVCRQCSRLDLDCNYAGSKRERQQLELNSVRSRVTAYESLLREIISESNRRDIRPIEEIISKHLQGNSEAFSTLMTARSLSDQHLPSPPPGISLARMHLALASNRASSTQPLQDCPPIQTSNIGHWTDLVDNTTASHLLSLYFIWDNPTWHLIDQEMFLRDLERGHTRFCSSLLVHALLFFGCSFSYHLARFTDRQEEKVLGQKLYSALQRLWNLEKDITCLPTAQSSIMIGLLCCTFGLDRMGTRYIMHGATLSRRLGLHHEHPSFFRSDGDEEAESASRCHKLVAWAVFDVQALAAQVYRKESAWKEPPSVSFSQTEAAALDEGDEWSPYPFLTPIFRPCVHTAARARGGLVIIVNEIAAFALKFPDSSLDHNDWAYGSQLYRKLLNWRASLPSIITPDENTSPHILILHMYYQATIVSLCEIFNLYSNSTTLPSSADFDTQGVKLQAMGAIGSLILLFQTCHGFKSLPIVMLHYFCAAGVHSISQLRPQDPKWSLVLESCVVGLWHMSLGWGRLCTAFLRTIELVLKATKPEPYLVSPKVKAVMQQLNTNRWTATDVKSLSADYVVYHVPNSQEECTAAGSRHMAHGLQNLIHAMDEHSLDDG
ncbi:putative C6 transcription factor [Aspergillus saccharolyticus JOP 1030-1]|uniref:Zn(II)2Cys6 transcription factor n=1 Tax=Aspergillus saccharolyticus JOP 1030-1 TaxID=1450539 RepID=A0A319ABH3_9EURO|nr:Zn(II)2Cys6 transcription factor [Aspergillus saccharolyticus JOP 1030-1]PYH48998.1 Zn(II)2Cys6 transcription factor [Aspergillus saccharolyticus JOP 1030-1]